MTEQQTLGLTDTDAHARGMRRIASRTKWQLRLTDGIAKKAKRIYSGREDQDSRILCPANYGGYSCTWVAGHYGGCSLNRPGHQTRLA